MPKIKHSHETGILSHLELVIMLTKATEELNIDKAEFFGDDKRLFQHVVQQAYEHGRYESDTAEPVDVAAMAKELPYRREEIQSAHDHLKLTIEAAARLALSHNMTLDHAAHRVGRMIETGAPVDVDTAELFKIDHDGKCERSCIARSSDGRCYFQCIGRIRPTPNAARHGGK